MSRVYKIGVHNEAVRSLTSCGKHHKEWSDSWASVNYISVEAMNAWDAERTVRAILPETEGFVIDEIE